MLPSHELVRENKYTYFSKKIKKPHEFVNKIKYSTYGFLAWICEGKWVYAFQNISMRETKVLWEKTCLAVLRYWPEYPYKFSMRETKVVWEKTCLAFLRYWPEYPYKFIKYNITSLNTRSIWGNFLRTWVYTLLKQGVYKSTYVF